jgi:hypothetical protein
MNRLTGDKSPYLSAHFYSLALKLCSKYEEEEELKRLAEEVVSTTPPLTNVFCKVTVTHKRLSNRPTNRPTN